MANPMIRGVLHNNVWYVNSRASNDVTNHGKWFKDKGFENIEVCGN
jgi:hypothetical protein